MHLKASTCCEPFVTQYGMPRQFVRALFTSPARNLSAYIDEKDQLAKRLEEIEACEHYRLHAFEQHSYIHDEMDDNRIWRAEVATAEYCGVSPRDYVEMLRQES